jgi:hypothetical protein
LHGNRSAELAVLHRAFAELDFAPPEIIENRDYVFAGFYLWEWIDTAKATALHPSSRRVRFREARALYM